MTFMYYASYFPIHSWLSQGILYTRTIDILPMSLTSRAWSIATIKVALRAGNGTQVNNM